MLNNGQTNHISLQNLHYFVSKRLDLRGNTLKGVLDLKTSEINVDEL